MELEALINSRPAARGQLSDWYRGLFHAAERDGVSVAELASRLGCSVATAYTWRRRLRGGAVQAEPTRRLVRVKVKPTDEESEPQRLVVRLRSGLSLTVPDSYDLAALAAVVKVLEQC